MKKICLFIVATIILGLILTGCGEKKPEALAGDHKTPSTMDSLKTSKKSIFFLSRGQNMYHLGEILEGNENYKTGLSLNHGSYHTYLGTTKLTSQELEKDMAIISMKDIPIPIIQNGDKICLWEEYSRHGLTAKPINFIGFTPLIYREDYAFLQVGTDKQNPSLINQKLGLPGSFTVYKADGNNIKVGDPLAREDIGKLGYEQRVIIQWKDKDTHKEQTLNTTADCSYYEYSGKTTVELPILDDSTEVTIYDPTKLDKGYWALCIGDKPCSVILVQ